MKDKKFWRSYAAGVVLGLILVAIFFATQILFFPPPVRPPYDAVRMLERAPGEGPVAPSPEDILKKVSRDLGISEEELKKELDSGKTMRQIMEEHDFQDIDSVFHSEINRTNLRK